MNAGTSKSSGSSEDLPQFKSFVSEGELEERRKRRQEEWEKARRPDQPLEAPEEEYDPRSLYDKLQAQKEAKDAEFHEQFKFKNQVRGIDDEEAKFLDFVSERTEELEKKRDEEDYQVIRELNKALVSQAPTSSTDFKASSSRLPQNQRKTQSALLLGAVKRKSTTDKNGDTGTFSEEKKMKTDDKSDSSVSNQTNEAVYQKADSSHQPSSEPITQAAAQVIGILPGMGVYTDSSDSDSNSSESDVEVAIFKKQIHVHVSNSNTQH